MPVHDWTRVGAGVFHHFHTRWISAIGDALNSGLLPSGYYALTEQHAGDMGRTAVSFRAKRARKALAASRIKGTVAVEIVPPRTTYFSEGDETVAYAHRRNIIAIHATGSNDLVAIVDVTSQAIKQSAFMFNRFVDRATLSLIRRVRLLVVDLFPPGRHDPEGIHGAIWEQFSRNPFALPADRRLTLVAYAANVLRKAYIEPTGIGRILPDMPLFITDRLYVNVPRERTYMEAYATVPERWRSVIEGRAT